MSGPESSRRSFLQWMVGTTGALVAGRSAEAAPRQGRRMKSAHETHPQPQKKSPEGKELPPGAFGFDHRGYPYGLHFRHQYVKEGEEPEIQLSESIPAKTRSGATKIKNKQGELEDYTVQFEQGVAEAWQEAEQLFAQAAAEDVQLSQVADKLYPTDGYRSFDEQREERRLKGAIAMIPGRSAHQIGRAIDIGKANRISVYKWLTGFDYTAKKFPSADFIPPLVGLGIIPTEPAEPWHWEFIGSSEEKLKEAEEYWRKFGHGIIEAHATKLHKDEE